jgi:hypothetical protein
MDPPNAVKCIPPESCLRTENQETVCKTGYAGFACGYCVPYQYYRRGGNCVACPGNSVKILTFVGAGVVVFVALFILFFKRYNVPVDVRIVLQTLQILSVFPQLSETWPPTISGLFHFLSFTVILIAFVLF